MILCPHNSEVDTINKQILADFPGEDISCLGADSTVDSAIVRAVIDLANAIGIATVAEGVENAEQVAELRNLGCQIGQGFFFSRPLPAADFDALLTAHFGQQRAWPPNRQLAV